MIRSLFILLVVVTTSFTFLVENTDDTVSWKEVTSADNCIPNCIQTTDNTENISPLINYLQDSTPYLRLTHRGQKSRNHNGLNAWLSLPQEYTTIWLYQNYRLMAHRYSAPHYIYNRNLRI